MRAHHFWMTITKREKLQCKIHNPAFIVSSSCQLRGRWCKLERIPDQWEEQCSKIGKIVKSMAFCVLLKNVNFQLWTFETIKYLTPKNSKLHYICKVFSKIFLYFWKLFNKSNRKIDSIMHCTVTKVVTKVCLF